MPSTVSSDARFDVLIVGAGFAGLYMLHRLRQLGLSARVLEAGNGVGGTWFWNRYPGARCDVESMQYSYQFSDELQREWEWTERYASQPEILRYANHVADRFDLRRDIDFDTQVTAATYDDSTGQWLVETGNGVRLAARFCIMATGCLSSTNQPAFPGLDSFQGQTFHTGRWPHEGVEFTGKRVGVIGTGSSAIQSVPLIAREAEELFVFQRTPNYAVPAHNGPLRPEIREAVKAEYPAMRARAKLVRNGIDFRLNKVSALDVTPAERMREYEQRWAEGGLPFLGAFADLLINKAANDTAAEFIRMKIRETVTEPTLALMLSPHTPIGCKRLCVDTGYFETYNRPNVTLVDVSNSPVEKITPGGLHTNGEDYKLDVLVFATGFDAMTGSLLRIDIRGSGGEPLKSKWQNGPSSYLGLAIPGFPNLFTITGPGSPSVLTNMLPSIEQHVEWIIECIAHLLSHGLDRIEATQEAEQAWAAHCGAVADRTLYPSCNSWYRGANVAGKPRVLMPYTGGFPAYLQQCADVVEDGYKGFALS
jgi:cation diffusion facilitator CzcD-associated flavoprotein CzcO